ncbi:MAG TPA: nucleoside deaminase [Chitinivibrionales bacterium]|nr:nucleoside deaminase [Chitinivibrionales bacterium]
MLDAQYFMNAAYQEAVKAFDEGEVPVGAVVEKGGRVIGRGYNRMEKLSDATAHAEIVAIGAASTLLETWRLAGCTLYVTLEPCVMCLGAALQARMDAVVYAAPDPRCGAIDTFFHRQELERAYRYFPKITSGVIKEECSQLLKSFFKDKRDKPAKPDR